MSCFASTLSQNQFLLTLWDDFAEVEGTELAAKLKRDEEFPVILGRNIGIYSYWTRFHSTICINSTYPQPLQLLNWAKTNKHLLSGHTIDSLARSSATLAMTPPAHSFIFIAQIAAQTSRHLSCINQAQQMLSNRLLYIQQRKSSWTGSNVGQPNLRILGYIEKERVSPLIGNRRNTQRGKSQGQIEAKMKGPVAENETSGSRLSTEPPTPAKML